MHDYPCSKTAEGVSLQGRRKGRAKREKGIPSEPHASTLRGLEGYDAGNDQRGANRPLAMRAGPCSGAGGCGELPGGLGYSVR